MMPEFHPAEDGSFPPPNWVWSTEEYDDVIDILANICTPFGYGSSFWYKFNDRKFVGFKMHDYHNLLHKLLPILVRDNLIAEIRRTIYKLAELFRSVCSKEIKVVNIWKRKVKAVEVLCEMEMHFPISVFNLQFDNIMHVVEEVELASLVLVRWMYHVERFLKVLKEFVR